MLKDVQQLSGQMLHWACISLIKPHVLNYISNNYMHRMIAKSSKNIIIETQFK